MAEIILRGEANGLESRGNTSSLWRLVISDEAGILLYLLVIPLELKKYLFGILLPGLGIVLDLFAVYN